MGKAVAALLLVVAAVARAGAAPDATPSGPRRTVVALYSISQEVAGLHELSLAVNEGIRRGSPVPADVYSEYTGLDRFPAEAYAEALRTMLQEKYHSRKIDLLVLVGPTALEFVVSKNLFPGVPIVTCYVAGRLVDAARRTPPRAHRGAPRPERPRTLELMLQLYPQTRRIHVVLGEAPTSAVRPSRGRPCSPPSPRAWSSPTPTTSRSISWTRSSASSPSRTWCSGGACSRTRSGGTSTPPSR